MSLSSPARTGPDGDSCAELRAETSRRCAEAHAAGQAHGAATEWTRALRRDLIAARHQLEAASAGTDPALRRAEKNAARDAYLLARQQAADDDARREAAGAWASAIDRINRRARLAARAVASSGAEVTRLETEVRGAERGEQAARMRAETAEAACLDARVRLASCEEQLVVDQTRHAASPFEPHAATGGHAVQLNEQHAGDPLLIEAIVGGDDAALELAVASIAEHGLLGPREARLQLQELRDAIVGAAIDEGYLAFDTAHPFWAQLTPEEARDVLAALGRLHFQLDPREGWVAGRVPTPADLSMALGYAGLDVRQRRVLPGAAELEALPSSIEVDGRAFLAAQAPDLAVDHLARILGRRASHLEPLWDAWGHVRPMLLSEARGLAGTPRTGD